MPALNSFSDEVWFGRGSEIKISFPLLVAFGHDVNHNWNPKTKPKKKKKKSLVATKHIKRNEMNFEGGRKFNQ